MLPQLYLDDELQILCMERLYCGLSPHVAQRTACVILQAFADDSENAEYFIVAGYVASLQTWTKFAPQWHEVLKRSPRLGYYRTNEAIARKGDFQHFDDRSRNERIAALASVIPSGLDCFAVASWVSKAELQEFWSSNFHEGWKDPYFLCAINLIQRLSADFLLSKPLGPKKVDFIFDRQGKIGDQLRSAYNVALKPMSLSRFPFLGDVRFEDKREFLPLQAADMQAGWMKRGTSTIRLWTSADVHLSRITQFHYPITRDFLVDLEGPSPNEFKGYGRVPKVY